MSKTPSFTSSPHMDQALAGFSAGIVSTVLLHPLDLIKIRFQVDTSLRSKNRPAIGATFKAFRDIVRQEGVFYGLYRGVTPNMTGAAASWGIYFWWYSMIKKYMAKDDGAKLAPWQHLVASAEAGAITAMITNPVWVIKTRMCTTTRSTPGAYRGLLDGLVRLAREEGLHGLYRGMVPALFGVSHGAIQFMVYEEMKAWRNAKQRSALATSTDSSSSEPAMIQDIPLSNVEYLTMAASSKTAAAVATYPYQVLRSRLQYQSNHDAYSGVLDCIRKIHHAEGYLGFYKGLAPSILRVLPGTCITFLVYENMSQWFKKNAR